MALPGYQEFMLPLLNIAADGQERSVADAMEMIAREMNIAPHDQDALIPSGTQSRFYNRVMWAITYLTKSLLLERSGRGRFRIAPRGKVVLSERPTRIDNAFLDQFPEYKAFKSKKKPPETNGVTATNAGEEDIHTTPDERLEAAYKELRETLADDLLERVKGSSPKFFEHLVVDLLKAMGYGGSHAEGSQVVGKSGDGGIDGVIQDDRLGLDMVYVQAKKWENSVGPDEIRKFVGSLGERRAHKGVFMTSGTFTSGARHAAERANATVVLIDGEQLAQLMIDYGVAVSQHKSFTIKKVDGDYFESF